MHSRQQVGIVLRLTNNSDKPIYSLLVDTLATENTEAASLNAEERACKLDVKRAWVSQGRGSTVPLSALGEEHGENAISAFLVKTEPGQTSEARVRGTVIGSPDCVLAGPAAAFLTATGPGADATPKLAFIQNLLDLQPKWTLAVRLIILLSDFGDAPDSTNHFAGVSMDAYPAVDARFPTVFDAATGNPPGPKHRNGRPLHLGALVSAELIVDAGLLKNIDPPNNNPDLDVQDDGIDPNALSFQHCFPTTIPVEVTVNQVAIDTFAKNDSHAYLNIWLDGNHDGDWEDDLDCDGLTAVEHIVIDQPINPSAPGTFTVFAPTGNIPVPLGGQNETMWLRATISDQPSVKTGQFQNPGQPLQEYGDGRGPATGLRWGETEDYLHVPPTAAAASGGFGVDMSIVAESSIQNDGVAEGVLAAGTESLRGRAFLKANLRNRGDRIALGSKLVIEMDPYGGMPPIIGTSWVGCLTCTVAASDVSQIDLAVDTANEQLPIDEVCNGSDCHLEINLGDVRPGQGGSILLGWADSNPQSADIRFTARVVSTGDVNGTNNQASSTARYLTREPIITSPPAGTLGWRGCLTCTYAFKGFGEPNSTLTLVSDGFESGDVTVTTDDDGFWKKEIRLVDGVHEVEIMDETVGATDTDGVNFNIGMPPTILTVDSSLHWDPTSFGMRKYGDAALQAAAIAEGDDSCGPWHFLDDAGRADPNGWKIPVWPGSTHELGVDLLCDDTASASLLWSDGSSIDFIDEDGDGRYTVSFTTPEIGDEVVVSLQVTCGEDEATYSGFLIPVEPAKVVNAETGDGLKDVAVSLWQRKAETTGAQLTPWEAQAFGQANPVKTDDEGQFSFITPPGAYGLTAQIDGFQPFRAGPLRLQGIFPSRSIALTPEQPAAGAAQVRITPDGFDPPYLEVEPNTTVSWLNTDLGIAQVETAIPAVAGSATSKVWNSGLLSTGQAYRQTFGQTGSFSYVNSQDPSSQATIVVKVKEPAVDGVKIYLPVIVR